LRTAIENHVAFCCDLIKLFYNNLADFTPPSVSGSSSISAGAVVGIVAAVAIVIILLFFILWWKGCFGKKGSLERGNL
jgi:hypothetical protein